MAAFTKINAFSHALGRGIHNFSANASLRAVLVLTSMSAGVSTYASLTEITAGNNYATGGIVVSGATWSTTAGTSRLKGNDVVWTASGGTIATFQFVVLVDDKAVSDELVGYWDFGTAVSVTNGNTFTVDIDPTNGILTVA